MNWGEPWYAGFRESQTEYRFNNQAYFQRNFMPGMLGWLGMTGTTGIAEIEWMVAGLQSATTGSMASTMSPGLRAAMAALRRATAVSPRRAGCTPGRGPPGR